MKNEKFSHLYDVGYFLIAVFFVMSQILPFDPFHIVVMCLCIAEWRIKNDMLHNFDKFLGILAINHYVIWIKM